MYQKFSQGKTKEYDVFNAMSNMSDVIWSLNSNESSLENFVEKIEEYSDDFFLALKIPYIIHLSEKLDKKKEINAEYRHELLMVFKEAFTNIIKHSHSNEVKSVFLKKDENFFISITNFFDKPRKAQFSTYRGLASIEKRIKSIKGNIKIINTDKSFSIEIYLKNL